MWKMLALFVYRKMRGKYLGFTMRGEEIVKLGPYRNGTLPR
jgi:hypothetical protein